MTFLDLPAEVRCRIYFFRAEEDIIDTSEGDAYRCGLDTPLRHLALGVREGTVYLYAANEYIGREDKLLQSYNQLRLISRQCNADMLPFLCSQYCILLHGTALAHVALIAARGLLDYFRHLIIDFDHALCNYWGCRFYEYWYHDPREPFNEQWKTDHEEVFHTALRGWQDLATRCSTIAHRLELGLRYRADDEQRAAMIVAPVHHLDLRKCFVYLGAHHYELGHVDVIRRAWRSMEDRKFQIQRFRFLDLPTEIRHKILGYTSLVAPLRQVYWIPEKKFALHIRRRHELGGGLPTCSWNNFCGNNRWVTYPDCSCFMLPVPYFLVSRAMLQDVQSVFFGSNRFIAGVPGFTDYAAEPHYSGLAEAISFFAEAVPRECLRLLRDVEIDFSQWNHHCDMEVDGTLLREWEEQISRIAPCISRLRLTIHLGGRSSYYSPSALAATFETRERQLHAIYRQVIAPLRALRESLRSFYVVIDDTLPVWMDREYDEAEYDAHLARVCVQEKCLEAMVMGDDYNSIADGKLRRRKSTWDTSRYPDGGPDTGDYVAL